jgi:ubiquitin-protein ligase
LRIIFTDHRWYRKQWRKDHPFGFYAKPQRNTITGVVDLKKWDCGVPGKENTIWAGGLFKLEVIFPDGSLAPSPFTWQKRR